MTLEEKQKALQQLGQAYQQLIQACLVIPGQSVPKQQAFLRFDEGHMWMQNAIFNYKDSEPSDSVANEPIQEPEVTPELVNEQTC